MAHTYRCSDCGWEGEQAKVVMVPSETDLSDNNLYERLVCPDCENGWLDWFDSDLEAALTQKFSDRLSKMEKVIRDGKVGVLVSPKYGSGWSTWNPEIAEILMFDSQLIEMVESGNSKEITEEFMLNEFGIQDISLGGVEELYVSWLPIGTKFRIHEYDGAEYIMTEDDLEFIA